jgi:hypothetical protein
VTGGSIYPVGGGRFGLRCGYHPDLVADLKAEIPRWAREWDPATKVWTFDRGQLDRVIRLCIRYLGEVDVAPELRPPAPPPRRDARLELLGRLIAPLSEAGLHRVYKIVAGEVHPDVGGDTRTMQQVNEVWQLIRRRAA